MQSEVVIAAEGLGKQYIIGHQSNERYQTLRDTLTRSTQKFVRSIGDLARGRPIIVGDTTEAFWALHDVDFQIRRGDVVGVIGRNGAGKSTLLKVLSRITEPSAGQVEIRGRMASLLEVGTGFHPELTGRENIFLNGAILGMGSREIRSKFDEIVEFSGVERFLDTPVKRYSSGMYVRLAFAVAAHLESEILVVDEVLAVGDADFQAKCLGKMESLSKSGRTVLFVSHNLRAVSNLCTRAFVFQDGGIVFDGGVEEGIERYLASAGADQEASNQRIAELKSGSIDSIQVLASGENGQAPVTGRPAHIEVIVRAREAIANVGCDVTFSTTDGIEIFKSSTQPIWNTQWALREDATSARLEMPYLPLTPGDYFLGVAVTIPNVQYLFRDPQFCKLRVTAPRRGSDSDPNMYPGSQPLWIDHKWTTKF